MEKIDIFSYKVNRDEEVTVKFTPIKVGPFADLAVDSKALTNVGGNTPTFKFKVTKNIGQAHFGHGRCDFPAGTEDGAKYTTEISGSFGGSFVGPTIFKNDPSGEFDLDWNVVAKQEVVFNLSAAEAALMPGGKGASKGAAKSKAGGAKKSAAKKGSNASSKKSARSSKSSSRKK